jgi:hypothetical protein
MIRQVGALGAIVLGIVLTSTCADAAQAVRHRVKHPAAAGAAGRQIIVRQGVEPWLTLGTWAPVGSRQGYALDTFRPAQRTSNEGTVVGVRGLDRLPNDIRLPEANRPLITVSSPGLSGPLFDWY